MMMPIFLAQVASLTLIIAMNLTKRLLASVSLRRVLQGWLNTFSAQILNSLAVEEVSLYMITRTKNR